MIQVIIVKYLRNLNGVRYEEFYGLIKFLYVKIRLCLLFCASLRRR